MSSNHSFPSNRLRASAPFVTTGTACVVGGGLISAILAHDPTRHAMWVVAYLVLVGGVAQITLGLGQTLLANPTPTRATGATELLAFNAANVAVLAGTLMDREWLVDVGGVVLAAALLLFLRGVRRVPASLPVMVYRTLIVFVLGSIPVGLVLAHV
jgi:hypothetical protein